MPILPKDLLSNLVLALSLEIISSKSYDCTHFSEANLLLVLQLASDSDRATTWDGEKMYLRPQNCLHLI